MSETEFDFAEEAEIEETVEDNDDIVLSGPITLDLGAVRDEPVAEGWHVVKIERAEAGVSRQKRIPKIFVLSRIIDEGDEDVKRTLIWNVMLAGDGMIFTKRCFKALGFSEVLDYPSVDDLCAAMIDHEVDVQVKHRVYNGEKQAGVGNWREPQLVTY